MRLSNRYEIWQAAAKPDSKAFSICLLLHQSPLHTSGNGDLLLNSAPSKADERMHSAIDAPALRWGRLATQGRQVANRPPTPHDFSITTTL